MSPQDKGALALVAVGIVVAFLAALAFIGRGH